MKSPLWLVIVVLLILSVGWFATGGPFAERGMQGSPPFPAEPAAAVAALCPVDESGEPLGI